MRSVAECRCSPRPLYDLNFAIVSCVLCAFSSSACRCASAWSAQVSAGVFDVFLVQVMCRALLSLAHSTPSLFLWLRGFAPRPGVGSSREPQDERGNGLAQSKCTLCDQAGRHGVTVTLERHCKSSFPGPRSHGVWKRYAAPTGLVPYASASPRRSERLGRGC